MSRSAGRRIARSVLSPMAAMVRRSPRLALRGADLLAPATRPLLRVPTAEQLRRLFPDLSLERARAIAARTLRVQARNELLGVWMRCGGRDTVRPLLAPTRLVLPSPPLILGTFHIGPTHVLGAALDSVGVPLLALKNTVPVLEVTPRRQQQHAARFHQAIEFLRGGGLVLMALDPAQATRIEVPFLGGTLRLARGAFALSRITGVPVVPVVARWNGTNVDVVVGDPLTAVDGPDLEQSLAASAARWLEDYLRATPEEISLRILDLMER